MGTAKKELTPAKATAIFISFTAYFYMLLFTLLPLLKANFALNPALFNGPTFIAIALGL